MSPLKIALTLVSIALVVTVVLLVIKTNKGDDDDKKSSDCNSKANSTLLANLEQQIVEMKKAITTLAPIVNNSNVEINQIPHSTNDDQQSTKYQFISLSHNLDLNDEDTKKAFKIDTEPLMTECDSRLSSASASCQLDRWKQTSSANTTLRQVLLVHRHADRTAIGLTPSDPLKNESFWSFHGINHLTHLGKARAYLLGNLVRQRYARFLNFSSNKLVVESRSSGISRCLETAQMFLSALFQTDAESGSSDGSILNWSPTEYNKLSKQWQPIPIETNDITIDGMLSGYTICKKLVEADQRLELSQEVKDLHAECADVSKLIKDLYGLPKDYESYIVAVGFIVPEVIYFRQKVVKQVLDNYDKIVTCASKAYVLSTIYDESKKLRAGLLINDIVNNMNYAAEYYSQNRVSKQRPKQFYHYSSHDQNVEVLLSIIKELPVLKESPGYVASIIFELHEDIDSKQWFVEANYVDTVPGPLVKLELNGCKNTTTNRCSLVDFTKFVDKLRVHSWSDWMKLCGNNLESVDIYHSLS